MSGPSHPRARAAAALLLVATLLAPPLVAVGRAMPAHPGDPGASGSSLVPSSSLPALRDARIATQERGTGGALAIPHPAPVDGARVRPAAPPGHVWNNVTALANDLANPGGRWSGVLTVDLSTGSTIYFGGCGTGQCPSNETWVFDGAEWHNATNYSSAPPARYGSLFWYDPALGVDWLFGGCGAVCPMNDTWMFHGGNWTNKTSVVGAAPPAVWDAAGTYWPYAHAGVISGGCRDAGCLSVTNDSYLLFSACSCWEAWGTAGGGGSGPAVAGQGLVDDPTVPGLVEFGGFTGCFGACIDVNDTWIVPESNASWTNLTLSSALHSGTSYPTARSDFGMTYDAVDGYVLLIGGRNDTTGGLGGDVHLESGGNWSVLDLGGQPMPPALEYLAVPSNSSSREPLLFGGISSIGASNQTWVWDYPIVAQAEILGQGRYSAVFAEPNQSVSFDIATAGGGTGSLQFVWNFTEGTYHVGANGTTTFNRTSPSGVPYLPRARVYDPSGNSILAYGPSLLIGPPFVQFNRTAYWTDVGSSTDLDATAYTSGSVTGVSWSFGDGTNATTLQLQTAHTWSQVGSYTVRATLADSFGNSGSSTVPVTVNATPAITQLTPAVGDVGLPIPFAAALAGGSGPFSYTWIFGDGGSSSLATPSHAFGSAGNFTVGVTVQDAHGLSASQSETCTVEPLPTVAIDASTSTTDVGRPVSLAAVGVGGVAPYTIAWSFGDGTSASGNSTTHAYSTPGSFTVQVELSDTLGALAQANWSLAVAGPPAIVIVPDFGLGATTAIAGTNFSLLAQIAGGVSPFTVTWSLGDGGSAAGSSIRYAFLQPGNFTVNATVEDGAGSNASTSLVVSVAPATSPTPTYPSAGAGPLVLAVGLLFVIIAGLGSALLLRRRRPPTALRAWTTPPASNVPEAPGGTGPTPPPT